MVKKKPSKGAMMEKKDAVEFGCRSVLFLDLGNKDTHLGHGGSVLRRRFCLES